MRRIRSFGAFGLASAEFMDSLVDALSPRSSGTALFIIGSALLGGCLWFGEKQYATKSWPTTTGTILVIGETSVRVNRQTITRPVLTCSYTVNGVTYQTDRVSFGLFGGRTLNTAYTLTYFAKGSSAAVFYNPANPQQAVLETGLATDTILVAVLGLLALLMGFLLLTTVHKQDLVDLGQTEPNQP